MKKNDSFILVKVKLVYKNIHGWLSNISMNTITSSLGTKMHYMMENIVRREQKSLKHKQLRMKMIKNELSIRN